MSAERKEQIRQGLCWCGRKARRNWTTCARHMTSGRTLAKGDR